MLVVNISIILLFLWIPVQSLVGYKKSTNPPVRCEVAGITVSCVAMMVSLSFLMYQNFFF